MSDPPAAAGGKPARSRGLVGLLVIPLAFAAGAAAGGFGAVMAAGKLWPGDGGGGGHAAVSPPASVVAPVEYVEIDTAFTSNLVDTGRYLQVRLSVSTTGGPEVVAAIERHKPALVSTILSVLGEMSENDVAERVGKDKLRARLTLAVNDTLRQRGVANAIDEVFFISLVVQ